MNIVKEMRTTVIKTVDLAIIIQLKANSPRGAMD